MNSEIVERLPGSELRGEPAWLFSATRPSLSKNSSDFGIWEIPSGRGGARDGLWAAADAAVPQAWLFPLRVYRLICQLPPHEASTAPLRTSTSGRSLPLDPREFYNGAGQRGRSHKVLVPGIHKMHGRSPPYSGQHFCVATTAVPSRPEFMVKIKNRTHPAMGRVTKSFR